MMNDCNLSGKRVPAEWESYHTVMIAWPHASTDWAPMLDEVEACYVGIAHAIVTDSRLRLLVVSPDVEAVAARLKELPHDRLILVEMPTNDTWTRDYGPVTVEEHGVRSIVDFQFNGWGLKFASNLDNMVNLRLVNAGVFTRNYRPELGFVFEGGALESDGAGTMLTTSDCLLSLNRNGVVSKKQLGEYFRRTLGMDRILFLDHGHLEGDDTDSHIDTLARFAPNDTIIYVKSYNRADSHTAELDLMESEIKALRRRNGQPYNLIALPLPDPIYDEGGERLPATYANFLITPETVLMPVYGQPDNDLLAHQMLCMAFPDRRIVDVDCRQLIRQHGSLHCATMQLHSELVCV